MPPVGFEPTISAGDQAEELRLDRVATGTGLANIIQNKITPIKIINKFFDRVEQFQHLPTTLTNHNHIYEQVNRRLKSGNACYHSAQKISRFKCPIQKHEN